MERDEAETTAMQNDTVTPRQPPSLFPVHLQPSVGNDGAPPEWLNNASFTTDLSVVNDSVASHYKAQRPAEEELESENEEEVAKEKKKDARPQYELLESSESDRGSGSSSSEEEEEKKSKKKRKKKKRKRNRELSGDAPPLYDYISSRKPDVRSWASSSSSAATNSKDYYFDSRGDRDNLAFGCLYRMDVARYKLYNSKKTSGLSYYRSTLKSSFFDGDDDIDSLDDKLRSGGRYWSPQYAALERHRNLKRMRVLAPEKMVSSISDDFIPLSDESSDGKSPSTATTVEESWEDEMLRKTKEFSRLTRERPHDEKIWSAFSEFQDKVASMQPQKGARLQTLEKKISILEKAVELNPDNEDLILSLMKAYQNRDSTDVLIGRWEKTLMKNSGSYRLWKEFLQVVQGEFSRFKVSEMRKMYANAIRALSGACNRQYRQVHQKIAGPSVDPDLAHLEVGLVEIFLGLCRFEWQTGHQELATALMQAEIEYSLFSPSLFLSEQSKRSLFEHFWNSNGARVGEDGALGWSTWLGKEEEERQKLVSDNLSCSDEEGGWTGWSEPQSKAKEVSEILEDDRVSDMASQESSDEHDTRDVDQNDDTETLLKRLGIDTAADANSEIKDTRTWTRWSEEELRRDSDQWMPLHTSVGNFRDDAEGDEQLSRVILYEDVTDYLFSLTSEEARLSLVSQFIEFFGGRISPWTCTNSSSWTEILISSEVILYAILEQFQRVYDVVAGNRNVSGSVHIESLVNNSDDISVRTNMMKFVRNATLLCLTVFPQNHILDEAVLIAEELSNTRMNSSPSRVTPCRALAKNLLKSNRQDILLCGAYARREAAFGNIDQARKIFDMALLSTEGLPLPDARRKFSLLNFWYAEMELANSSVNSKESFYRAMHILSCLGCGVKYTPYIGQPTSLQQLRARQGFKEQIRMLRSTWTRGVIDDSSISLICSAALFEELTAGPAAGIEVLDDAFTMVLPERRRNSYQLEILFNYYIRILYKHRKELKLSKIWEAIVKGLQMYPSSPGLYGVLVEISHLHTSPNKLRWILDDYSSKKQSLVAFLFSLSFEISKGSPSHRIRAMFERGLVNGRFNNSVVVWRCYIAYESDTACDPTAARRVYFRAIHACPWSKKLWLDGFLKLNSVLTAKELSDLQEVMRDKELNLRTDIYEILLQDEMDI